MDDIEKRCYQCGFTLPIDYFSRNKSRKDGRQSMCIKCRVVYDKLWREKHSEQLKHRHTKYYTDNKDRIKEYNKRYLETHREQRLETARKSKRKYMEKRRESHSIWLDKNRDLMRSLRKAWKVANPNKNRQYKLKRKAIEAGLVCDFTAEQWEETLFVFNNSCVYCGATETFKGNIREPLHQDHFISIANGGGYTMGNIVPACRKCNCGKANRDKEWIVRKFGQEKYDSISMVLLKISQCFRK